MPKPAGAGIDDPHPGLTRAAGGAPQPPHEALHGEPDGDARTGDGRRVAAAITESAQLEGLGREVVG